MTLQQLRYLREIVRQNLHLSNAAEALFTSQPGISRQIHLLEEELGVDILVRHGKRLVGITEPGREVVRMAERMLRDVESMKRVGEEFKNELTGSLTIATTHTQARYVLPSVIQAFAARFPQVKLSLHQGNPVQVAEHVLRGEADVGIATEALESYRDIVSLPCYQWNRVLVAPVNHPLLKLKKLTLEDIAAHPLITYDDAFTGRNKIDAAFSARNLSPNVVLTALDSDVIKTYVGLGLGVGILAQMAFEPKRDIGLAAMDCSHLFQSSTTRIATLRDGYLRGFVFSFMELFAPQLTRKVVESAMAGGGSQFEL